MPPKGASKSAAAARQSTTSRKGNKQSKAEAEMSNENDDMMFDGINENAGEGSSAAPKGRGRPKRSAVVEEKMEKAKRESIRKGKQPANNAAEKAPKGKKRSAAQQLQDELDDAAEEAEVEAPKPKRGRGRPAKTEMQPAEENETPPKNRGRPARAAAASAANKRKEKQKKVEEGAAKRGQRGAASIVDMAADVAEGAIEKARGRGRPKKFETMIPASIVASERKGRTKSSTKPADVSAGDGAAGPSIAPKRRGRPPKSSNAAKEDAKKLAPATKRKRGAEDDEGEEESSPPPKRGRPAGKGKAAASKKASAAPKSRGRPKGSIKARTQATVVQSETKPKTTRAPPKDRSAAAVQTRTADAANTKAQATTTKGTARKGAAAKNKGKGKAPATAPEGANDQENLAIERAMSGIDEEPAGPRYWLMKAEPESRIENGVDVKFSIDNLLAATEPEMWDGVRNYLARNNMKAMKKGDRAFFYHSNCKVPGIAGLMEIVEENVVDESAFNAEHPYYDAKSKREKPTWYCVRVSGLEKFPNIITLKELQVHGKPGGPLENMQLLKQSRLSVNEVMEAEYNFITTELLRKDSASTDAAGPSGPEARQEEAPQTETGAIETPSETPALAASPPPITPILQVDVEESSSVIGPMTSSAPVGQPAPVFGVPTTISAASKLFGVQQEVPTSASFHASSPLAFNSGLPATDLLGASSPLGNPSEPPQSQSAAGGRLSPSPGLTAGAGEGLGGVAAEEAPERLMSGALPAAEEMEA